MREVQKHDMGRLEEQTGLWHHTRAGRFRAKPKIRNVQSSYSSNSIIAMPELNLSNNIVNMYVIE